jgi:hypothetical protein
LYLTTDQVASWIDLSVDQGIDEPPDPSSTETPKRYDDQASLFAESEMQGGQ